VVELKGKAASHRIRRGKDGMKFETRTPGHLQELMRRVREVLPLALRETVEAVPVFQTCTEVWHHDPDWPVESATSVLEHARLLHMYNFRLWHSEDKVRRPDAPDRLVAHCKHAIDAFNQQRNDQIERLDDLLFACLYVQHNRHRPEAELHAETPGSLLDRLSILVLKVYHMAGEAQRQEATAQHRQRCQQRLAVLEEQRGDMWACLCRLALDLWDGRKVFKVYRQFKMYNDPELNPEIYRHRAGRSS
jgi:hypothetical protein